ncbi:Cyclic nucleotide-binding protein [Pseudocohnilembus persalinus]|uniref:Cyclic nucleotide-binding protein n=1 Tax=Pseudocohnilembus persalinus TaxID=266149 RepID=A0A0V0QRM4_PSEPJ|nr:Cyclic nucleotide-binding protein [Pseudocohnilembus persalinus]|eukprot:KRX04813.1 Cyclic nucleotide-binding protein [Pseudocohnilembus persalinus]
MTNQMEEEEEQQETEQGMKTIQPGNIFKLFFDLFFCILIVLRLFIWTVQLSFCLYEVDQCVDMLGNYFDYVVLVSFLINYVLQLNSGYFENGNVNIKKKEIIANYFDNCFCYDLIAFIPVFYNSFINDHSSDIAIYIGVIQVQNNKVDNSWISHQGYMDKSYYERYIYSFYWSTCTMVTILIFVPQSQIEILFSIIAIFITCGLFGYTLNTIGLVLDTIYKKENDINREKSQLSHFLFSKQISQNLKEKIQGYFNFLHKQQKNINTQEEQEIISKLSPELLKQLKNQLYKPILKKFTLLKCIFSDSIIQDTMTIIEEQFKPSGTILYQQGETASLDLYLLLKGKVAIMVKPKSEKNKKKQQIIIKNVKVGEQFGQIQFFTGLERQQTAVCIEPCTILKIQRQQFIELLDQHQQDKQIFFNLKDTLLNKYIYQNNQEIQEYRLFSCEICDKNNHYTQYCPQISLVHKHRSRQKLSDIFQLQTLSINSVLIQKKLNQNPLTYQQRRNILCPLTTGK